MPTRGQKTAKKTLLKKKLSCRTQRSVDKNQNNQQQLNRTDLLKSTSQSTSHPHLGCKTKLILTADTTESKILQQQQQ